MALENAKLYEDARKLADHDHLTGFFNHRYVHERIGEELVRAQRSGSPVSLLMIDLDDFKLVNDTFGHLFGDRVLVWSSELIRSSLRQLGRPGPLRRRRVRRDPARHGRRGRDRRRRAHPRRVHRAGLRVQDARTGARRGIDRPGHVPARRADRPGAHRRRGRRRCTGRRAPAGTVRRRPTRPAGPPRAGPTRPPGPGARSPGRSRPPRAPRAAGSTKGLRRYRRRYYRRRLALTAHNRHP